MDKIVIDANTEAEMLVAMINLDTVIPLSVTGTSMLPFILPNDVVWLKKYDYSVLHEGQIVLFRREGETGFVLHRIFDIIDDNYLRINGDAQVKCELIEKSQVIATVEQITRDDKILETDTQEEKEKLFRWRKTRLLRPVLIRLFILKNRRVLKLGAETD